MTSINRKFKFSTQSNADFVTTLRERVNAYFETNNIERHGGAPIIIKTVIMFILYFTPLVLMIFGVVTNPWLVISMWLIMGLGGVGIGVNVMHDANHGAFCKSAFWNNLMGKSVNLIGGNARTWKLQHNVLHHAYTNVHGMDHDLDAPIFLRFSPHQEKRWYHRFQHIYAWFFYGLQTLARTLATDFKNAKLFRKEGLIKNISDYRKMVWQITVGKLIYFTYILAIPLIFAPIPWWLILLGFATMHYVSGLVLALIFQSAHVMPELDFALPDGEVSENNWSVHQMRTTTNFSPKSRIFSWFVGGLNFQIEHHLFSNIAHTHYRSISTIVSETAKEFGIKYHTQRNFAIAIWEHGKMLKRLGNA